MTTKLLMTSAERSTKWCHSNDEETGNTAVQRLNMLPNTAKQKAYVTPTVIYGAWCTLRIKKERRPGFAQLNEPCYATQRPPSSPRGCVARLLAATPSFAAKGGGRCQKYTPYRSYIVHEIMTFPEGLVLILAV